MRAPASLEPRKRPVRANAKASVDRILDAAAALLDEAGFEALTTIRIAERAQVNIASLYSYFPNKHAVLSALSDRMAERQLASVRGSMSDFTDWREALDTGLDAFVAMIVKEPGFAALANAVRACPSLQPLADRSVEPIAQLVTAGLRERGARVAPQAARTIARVVVEAGAGVVNVARESEPRERKRLIQELKVMIRAYLDHYLA
jgi:AcrR family transcriptional regulator